MLSGTYGSCNGWRPKLTEGGSADQGELTPWSDLPLLKYETEVFVQVGAWKNLEELENSLLLHELFLLYRACGNEYSKTIKASALAWGGEIDFDDDWYDPSPPPEKPYIDSMNYQSLPIGIGYSTE